MSTKNNGNHAGKGFNPQDFCKRYNRGRCSFGQLCKFKHRCLYCGKFGHGVINCRQLKNDINRARDFDRFDRRDRDKHDRYDHYGRYDRDRYNHRFDKSRHSKKNNHDNKGGSGNVSKSR